MARAFLPMTADEAGPGDLVAVAGICLAYTHHLIGPRVAMLRQIAALKRGDYSARVSLRESSGVRPLSSSLITSSTRPCFNLSFSLLVILLRSSCLSNRIPRNSVFNDNMS